MLDLTRVQSGFPPVEMPLAIGVDPIESGLAMVRVADAQGNEVIKPSTGVANEAFVGVAYLDKHAAAQGVRIEYHAQVPSAPGPYVVTVPDATISNLSVVTLAGVPIALADITVTGNQLAFIAAHAGKEVLISYNYAMTPNQLMALGISPIPSSAAFLRQMAVLAGFQRVYVSNFDASQSYSVEGASSLITLGDKGLFTLGGLGSQIARCFHVPTAQDPWLGLQYNA